MAQTKAGAAKAAATNKARYGDDFFARMGARGGSVKGTAKGFAYDPRPWWRKLLRRKNPRAVQLGRKGGHVSKRRPVS